jgi:hypothetical protein
MLRRKFFNAVRFFVCPRRSRQEARDHARQTMVEMFGDERGQG